MIESSPTRRRGPFTRWPRTADACLAIVVFFAAVWITDVPNGQLRIRSLDDVPVGDYAFAAIAAGALYWRRSRPLVVLATVILAAVTAILLGLSDISGIVVLAVYSVGRYVEDDLHAYLGGFAAAALIGITGLVLGYPADEIWAGLFATLLSFFIGWRIRARRLRVRQQDLERTAQMHQAVAEERTRIARELHDVVAHHVSVMTVQAGAARTVAGTDPEAASQAMEAVEMAGREVLGELRDLLDVLRPDTSDVDLGPQPTLDDLPRLLDRLRTAGMSVELIREGDGELSARVDLFAYRIVQEALTNVLKHAGPAATARVSVTIGDQVVKIEVSDDGFAQPGTSPQNGHGLIGMRERARLLGGTLSAGPGPEGGFVVAASLPRQQEPM